MVCVCVYNSFKLLLELFPFFPLWLMHYSAAANFPPPRDCQIKAESEAQTEACMNEQSSHLHCWRIQHNDGNKVVDSRGC